MFREGMILYHKGAVFHKLIYNLSVEIPPEFFMGYF